MDNTRIVDEESTPLVEDKDRDYDDYNTPNTSRVDEISFTEPDPTKATSTLQLRQKVKRDKITAMNLTGDPGLADMDQFMIKKKKKQATLTCSFLMEINIGHPSLINVLVSF